MRKIIGTESKKLNEIFTQNEFNLINGVVNDNNSKALIIKPVTAGVKIYLDFDGNASVEDGYPIASGDSISFSKGNLSRVQICSDTENTDIRILFV